MKKASKKILILFMACSMLLSSVCVSAGEESPANISAAGPSSSAESYLQAEQTGHTESSGEYIPLYAVDAMPKSGKYILAEDRTMTAQCLLSGSLDLDLGGHTIFINDSSAGGIYGVFRSNDGAYKLNLTSSQPGGTIEYLAGKGSVFFTPSYNTTNYPNVKTVTNSISNITVKGYNADAQMICFQAGTSMEFINCRFEDCRTSSANGLFYLYNTSAVRFTGCTFTNCSSSGVKSAMYIYNTGVTFTDCTIDNCDSLCTNLGSEATYKYPGGLATITGGAKVNVSGGSFKNCNSKFGGSVFTVNGGELCLDGAYFTANNSSDAGGVAYVINSSAASATVKSCTITGNSGKICGAIYCGTAGSITLDSCSITDNSAANSGQYSGAVYSLSDNTTLKGGNIIKDNYDSKGGKANLTIQNPNTSGSTVTKTIKIIDSTADANVGIKYALFRTGCTVIGSVTGELLGKYSWDNDSSLVIKANGAGELTLSTDEPPAGEHVHGEISYEPWPGTTSIPTSGNYYLTKDVELSGQNILTGNLNLCLNGHTIRTTAASAAIYGVLRISKNCNYTMYLTSCEEDAYIDGAHVSRSAFMLGTVVGSKGKIKLENLSIKNIDGSASGVCICIQGETSFEANNIDIYNNTMNGNGGAYYSTSTGTTVFKDCRIHDISSACGAVYIQNSGQASFADMSVYSCTGSDHAGVYVENTSLFIGGNMQINGNTAAGIPNDLVVQNSSVTIKGSLSSGSLIGLNYTNLPEMGDVLIAGAAADDINEFYINSYTDTLCLRFDPINTALVADYVPSGSIAGAELLAGDDFTMNFYCKYNKAFADRMQLRIINGSKIALLDGEYQSKGEFYWHNKFSYTGISSQQMADALRIELICDDQVLDVLDNWSVQAYMDTLHTQKGDDTTLASLLADTLCYGAASQLYINHNADLLADTLAWISESKTDSAPSAGELIINQPDKDTVRIKGATLRLDNKISLYYSIYASAQPTVTIDLEGAETELKSVGENEYLYIIRDMNPSDYSTMITLDVSALGKNAQLVYSVNNYLASKANDPDTKLAALVKAIYNYGTSAAAYVEAHNIVHDLTKTEFHVGVGYEWESFTQCLIDLQDNSSEKTIYVHPGTYDIFREYKVAGVTPTPADLANTADYMPYNVIVPANTHIVGLETGTEKVKLIYFPTKEETYPLESKVVSVINTSYSCTIENMELYGRNCRYLIHDETLGMMKFSGCERTYSNIRMYRESNDFGYGFGHCLGMGLDDNNVTFNDCIFSNCISGGKSFYMHNRAKRSNGQFLTKDECGSVTLNRCIIDRPNDDNMTTMAMFFGNVGTTETGANLCVQVTMNDCRIKGFIKVCDEATTEGATRPCQYRLILNRCNSDVTFKYYCTENKYEPIINDPSGPWSD